MYVQVPSNCTDKCQPLDLNVNKPAKDYMKAKFQEWYGNIILQQLETGVQEIVDTQLSIMKPQMAQWMMDLYDNTCKTSLTLS